MHTYTHTHTHTHTHTRARAHIKQSTDWLFLVLNRQMNQQKHCKLHRWQMYIFLNIYLYNIYVCVYVSVCLSNYTKLTCSLLCGHWPLYSNRSYSFMKRRQTLRCGRSMTISQPSGAAVGLALPCLLWWWSTRRSIVAISSSALPTS